MSVKWCERIVILKQGEWIIAGNELYDDAAS